MPILDSIIQKLIWTQIPQLALIYICRSTKNLRMMQANVNEFYILKRGKSNKSFGNDKKRKIKIDI